MTVLTVHRDNIRYDLLRTGSVTRTTNTILERGFLPAVSTPAYTSRHFSLCRSYPLSLPPPTTHSTPAV